MSMELIAIISVGVMLGGLILNGQHNLRKEMRADFKAVREDINGLRERMAHLEGLLEGLCAAITGRHVAVTPANYDTR